MNQMGLGMTFEAKDLASGVMGRVANAWMNLEGRSSAAGKAIGAALKDFGVGAALMGAGLVGLSSLSAPIDSAKKFEAAIAEVTTETDAASLSYESLRKMGLDLATQFGKMPVEEAKGLYQAVAAGADNAGKATALMTGANKLAIGGITTVETAIDGLTSALNAYGMQFTEGNIQGVSDAFFIAMRDGKTKVGDLAQQIGRVAPSAHALGISFDEVLASISAMTGSGLKADMAITGLHGALANIVRPSSEATAEAARLGIKFDQTTLRAKGWKGFLDQITTSAHYNANSLSKLFTSVEGLNAIQALTTNSSQKFNAILGDMATKSGATQNAFDKMSNTLDFSDNKFEALSEVAKILVGEALLPLAKTALKVGSTIFNAFNSIPEPIRTFMVQAFAAGSAVLGVVGTVIALKAAFAIGAAGASALGISFGSVLATLAPVVVLIGLGTLAFFAFRQAYETNLGGFGDFIRGNVAKVTLAFRALVQLFSQGGFSGDVLKSLDAGNEGVESFAINIYVWVTRAKNWFAGLAAGFESGISRAQPVFDEFMKALDKLAAAFGLVDNAVDPISNGGKFIQAGTDGADMGAKLAEVATTVVKLSTAFIDVGGDIANFIDDLGGVKTVAQLIADVYIARLIFQVGSAAISFAKAIPNIVAFTAASWSSVAPWAALTLMIASALAVLYEAIQLYKEWDDLSSTQIGTELKHDFGFTNDAEYEAEQNKRMGLHQGGGARRLADGSTTDEGDYDLYSGTGMSDPNAPKRSGRSMVTYGDVEEAGRSPFAPTVANISQPFPAGAQAQPSGDPAVQAQIAAALQAVAKLSSRQPVVQGTVTLDGTIVGVLNSMQTSDASRGGEQTSVPD